MVITKCTITLHESLFFATREIGRLYETGRYLHNYALSYAFGFASSRYHCAEQVPQYAEELPLLNLTSTYITPAEPLETFTQLATFKYGEEQLHVEMLQATRNTPSFGRAKEIAVGSRFECYVFSQQPIILPRWIRLGKWHSKALVEWKSVAVQEKTGAFVCPVPLNPLDVPKGMLRTFDIISMPPASLVANARLDGRFYDLGQGRGLPVGMSYTFPQAEPAKPKARGKSKT